MRKMTEDNLKNAFAGESQAHMRYLIFADKAAREGKPNIARLFQAIAYAEEVHATNHYRALGNIRGTPENIEVCIAGETYEIEEMYPSYHAVAQLQGEKAAERSTAWALEAEKIHASLYTKAKLATAKKEDLNIGHIYICEVCGHTAEDSAPEVCPVCGSNKLRFREF
ncbi:MAG: rubrerythrin family protein [Chloroflexi bacterium]|nr:rubrerythrin family protein [Chloroflexota bacterium]